MPLISLFIVLVLAFLLLLIRAQRRRQRILSRPWWAQLGTSTLVWREERCGYSEPNHEFVHQAWERIFEEGFPERSAFLIYYDEELEVWRRGQKLVVITSEGDEIRQLNRRDA